MRRILFSTIALFALLFSSCELLPTNEEIPAVEGGNKFRVVSDTFIEMPAEGGNAEIEFVIDTVVEGAKLTASSAAEWITNIEVNDTITFYVESNTAISERLGSVTLRYADTTVVVAIEQQGRAANDNATLVINSERTLEFNAFGGSGTIEYTLTGAEEGDKPIVDSNQTWIDILNVESDKINFEVEPNTIAYTRRGNITVSYGATTLTIQVRQEAASTEPILTANKANIKIGESLSFTVTLANTDVTASSKICDYYTRKEVPNPYTPTEVAEYVFIAEYNGYTSNVFTVSVVSSDTPSLPVDSQPANYAFNQRILLIDHTGAGCGYCPEAKAAFKDAEEDANYKDKFNVVYAYSYNSNELCYSSTSLTVKRYFETICSKGNYLSGYPSFTTNYCYSYVGKFNVKERIDQFWNESTVASIALATKRDGNKLIVNAGIKSAKSQSYKISLWLLEDDVYATQSGATASWMHTHHNVLRDAITGVSTSDIAGIDFGYVTANSTYERVMEFDLFVANSWNINNCKLIAIISAPNSEYDNKYEVVNTAICDFNSSIGFDYKK